MKIFFVTINYIFFFIAGFTFQANIYAQEADIQQRFEQAKKLIESNCGDCMGGTKKGLEEGIAELSAIMDLGYSDKVKAYKLLAYAYNEMSAVYATPDSDEQKRIRHEINKVYEQLVKLEPNDPKILYDYARYLDDKDAQLSTYRKIVQIEPDNIDARFAFGNLLLERGKVNEGFDQLRETLKRASERELKNYGRRTIELLEKHGRKKEAKNLKSDLERKGMSR